MFRQSYIIKLGMNRQEKLRNKRIIRNSCIIFVCIISIFIIGRIFIDFSQDLDNELDESATSGIEETYKEVGKYIASVSESRINYLELLGIYIDSTSFDSSNYINIINEYKEKCGFTSFYILNENGAYLTLDGELGTIEFGKDISFLYSSYKTNNTIVDGILPNGKEMIFYIEDTKGGTYNGFEYSAISFGYDKQDLINSINIDAYDGQGIAYIAYDDGKMIARLDDQTVASNVFKILEYSSLSKSNVERIEDDFKSGGQGTIRVSGDKSNNFAEEYYFSYQPIKYQEWMLVAMVPVETVNKTLNQVRQQTTFVIVSVFSTIFLIMLGTIVFIFKNTIKSKDRMIIQRNIVFDLVCDNLNEIYVLFNTKSKEVEYISPNIEKLLNISFDEAFNDPSKIRIYHGKNESSLTKIINNFIAKDMYDFKDDVYLDALNSKKKVLYSLRIYRQNDSNFGVVVLSDRTEENKIRQELQDALEGARAANESKTAFLSSVSHDMRTPMNAIVGFASLIQKDPSDADKVLNYISKINLSSRHLLNLINEVLDYSKIEAGKTTLNIEPINIDVVINSIDSIIRPQALEKQQTFNITKNCSNQYMVEADELRLSQILINIISNSIKYTNNGGTINFNISSKKFHQYIQYTFVIEDNGVGMSKEYVKKIFEPFSREETVTTNKVQGTGLGMSITKNLIDLMGGSIDIESTKDVGSKFTVVINFTPCVDLEATTSIKTNEILSDYSLKGLNILAAEDNDLNAEIIKTLLEDEGAHIEIAKNGQECLDKFKASKENEYDLILMDIQMPILNGLDATVAIRNLSHPSAKNIPIIAMTANAFMEDVNNSLKAGMNGHVSKPIDMAILKNTIKQCIENKPK